MLSLTRNGFPANVVRDVLHFRFGSAKISFRHELLDSRNNRTRDIPTMLSASVEHNATRTIKRTARFSLVDDGTIDFLSDRIKPFVQVWIPNGRIIRQYYYLSPWQVSEQDLHMAPENGGIAEFPLGVFLLSTPTKRIDASGTITRDIEAYDQGQVLVDDKVIDRYTIAAGTKYIDAVRTLLVSAGITQHNLTQSDKTLPSARDWEPGTPKGKIIDELLAAINYRSLWFDENGYAIASPYVSPDAVPSAYTYRDDSESVIMPEAEQSLDLFNVPNQWVVYTSESDGVPMRSVYTNSSGNSPTSTVRRGRTIVAPPIQVDAVDQITLDSMAKRKAFEASQVYDTVRFQTSIMPMHAHADVITLEYAALGASAKFEEVGWSFDLVQGGAMQHDVRRIVTV